MIWAKWGSVFMFLGVALGAFGSHILRTKISDYYLDVYKTGVWYHLVHALGLFAVAWLSTILNDPKVDAVGYLFVAGILFFSGSLYLLAITGQKWLGAVTPLGGLSMLTGWAILFFCLVKK